MSEVIIVLLLLIPVVLVILILNRSQRKHKRNEQEKLSNYVDPIVKEMGISPDFRKQLVHQIVVMDEKKKNLLLVNWKDFEFSHELHNLEEIKSLSVQTVKQNIIEEGTSKPDVVTTQVGIDIKLQNEERRFLVFYNHTVHTVFQIQEMTAEANALCGKVNSLKTLKPSKV